MNWICWDGEKHISFDPKVFEHLSGVKIGNWDMYNRLNFKKRCIECLEMLRGMRWGE